MLKTKNKFLIILIIAFFILTPFCLATNEQTYIATGETANDIPVTSSDDDQLWISSDLYQVGNDILLNKIIDGNTFIIGNNVIVNTEINGDLFVVANTLKITNEAIVYGNIFSIASELVMNGNAYDMYAFSENFTLEKDGFITRDLRVSGGNVVINGTIKRDVYVSSQVISLAESNGMLIFGDLTYTTDKQIQITDGIIRGEIKYNEPNTYNPTTGDVITSYVISFFSNIIYAIAVMGIIICLTPNFINKSAYVLIKKPFITAGVGILSIILIPIVCIFGLFTILGLGLFSAILNIYILVLSITFGIMSIAIGKYFANKLNWSTKPKLFLASVLTAIVLWILRLIPYIGWYVSLFITVIGLGIFVTSLFIKKDFSIDKETTQEVKE